ncbi:hypothetical protein H5410_003199 [Solanum commersonii]|uniref:Uncharacterized protein n=1 Tax=Solanum commersonii TaxID=4109 RepID=A0A9J6B4F9_SOLCO|nr:hypothetical protein H5410_003199 [Solanum commersonii]
MPSSGMLFRCLMFSQVVAYQACQERVVRQDVADTSRIHEFLKDESLRIHRKVFEVMHVINVDKVDLAAYQVKGITRIWYDQCVFMGSFFPRELREAKMVVDMRRRMSLFVSGLSLLSSKEGKAYMFIGDMDIERLMI